MAEIVLAVASKVAEYLVAPVGRQCGYLIFSDSYICQLNGEVEKLGDARDRVQHSVNEARNQIKQIEADVEKWMKEAETIANTARSMLGNDGRAKKTCLCGWLPNPKERYCLGRKARKTVQTIQALIPQGKFEKVYYESAPPRPVGSPPDMNLLAGDGGNTIADSRAYIIQGIMEALDDEKLKVIGVYGPGGVGKTTLLKQVKETLEKKGRPFDTIVTAEVSQNPDLFNIQGQIADALGLSLKDKETQQGRKYHLLKRLQSNPNEKFLIILDDLWKELNLEAVGIPSGDTSGKCKLLLTSRFGDVLEQKMLADRTFFLKSLNNDEAFGLFEKTVGNRLEDKELKAIAAQVVNKLAGLPLFIISIAKTLKNSSAYAWRNALIKIDEPNVETILKLSYDHLESEDAKSLFLLCGLIGGTIEVKTLFVLGMGVGLFERFDETIQGARDRLNTLLDSLCSICLLQDGSGYEKNVIIHDLYSEVVVSIPFRGQNSLIMNSNYGPWQKEKFEKCWAICLADVERGRLAELMTYRFPNLKILMLSQQKYWYDAGDCLGLLDFKSMKGLQALYIQCIRITSLPSSIGILGNLHSLHLDHCDVEDAAILSKLKALQILSFTESKISRLPKEIGDLTNLRLLNLSNCEQLKIIEPGALKGLINLEELHMKESFVQWMGVDEIQSKSCNARLAELKSLTKLTSLEISIRDPTVLMEDDDLPCGNLINFWIHIGNGMMWTEYEGLRIMKLYLEGCDHILSREWIKKTLQNTQYLHLDGMREFKKNVHELCIGGFPHLKHLDIEDSPSIKYIASSSDGAFPNLESLSLTRLINLEKICHACVDSVCFSKLKIIKVSNCDQLKYLWCLSQMQRLVQIEEISIDGCHSMQAISTDDAGKDFGSIDNVVELPNVRLLELVDLPNMTSFCTKTGITSEGAPLQAVIVDEERGDEGTELVTTTSDLQDTYSNSFFDRKVTFPNIRRLTIKGVPCEELWNDQIPTDSFCKLESLELKDCDNLLRIASSHMWKRLQHCLENLKVISCRLIEIIFKGDGMDTGSCKLRTLDLSYLDNLTHIWWCNGPSIGGEIQSIDVGCCQNMKPVIVGEGGRDGGTDDIIEFPLLQRLRIYDCPMKKFFSCPHGKKEPVIITSNSQDTCSDSFFDRKVSFPNIRKLEINGAQCKELWNNQIPNDSFGKLESLKLNRCDNLQYIVPSHMWKRLHHSLKEVQVTSCHSTEIIFEGDGGEIEYIDVEHCQNMEMVIVDEGGRDGGTNDIIEFSLLQRLHINDCPVKKFFSCPHGKKESVIITSNSQDDACADSFFNRKVSFPNIRELEIEGAQCKELWNNQIPNDSFGKLESLKLNRCDNLQHIFPSHMWKRLHHSLKEVQVTSCHSTEIIFEGDGIDTAIGKLKTLVLSHLNNLRHIWQYNGLLIDTTTTFSIFTTSTLFDLSKFRSILPHKYIV